MNSIKSKFEREEMQRILLKETFHVNRMVEDCEKCEDNPDYEIQKYPLIDYQISYPVTTSKSCDGLITYYVKKKGVDYSQSRYDSDKLGLKRNIVLKLKATNQSIFDAIKQVNQDRASLWKLDYIRWCAKTIVINDKDFVDADRQIIEQQGITLYNLFGK
jgi:hypothetical protein